MCFWCHLILIPTATEGSSWRQRTRTGTNQPPNDNIFIAVDVEFSPKAANKAAIGAYQSQYRPWYQSSFTGAGVKSNLLLLLYCYHPPTPPIPVCAPLTHMIKEDSFAH